MRGYLWIRSEAFDHGVFNTSVRWTASKVLDFLGSLRVVVAKMHITLASWVEVTTSRCKGVALTEAEAVAYWHVFSVLQQSILGKNEDWLDIRIIGIVLMCQVFSPHRVRSDHIAMSTEMWPSNERANVSSPRHSPRGSSPRVAVASQSPVARGRDAAAALLNFVRQHFGHFLQITCFALTAEPDRVSTEEFDVLGLILGSGTPTLSESVPDLIVRKSLPLKDLRKWVETNLTWNDKLYPAVEHGASSTDVGLARLVNISGLHKTTWFQRPSQPTTDFLNITSCTDCVIYITSHARFCLIAGCHECTVVMCAVSGVCTIQNCEKISVHVAAHCFKMENSIDSSAYLYSHVPPILTGDTRGIKLAPFNVIYSQMASVLQGANMRLEPEFVDVWAHPVCCTLGSPDGTMGGRSGQDDSNTSTYHFVHPKNFQPLVVPEASKHSLSRPTLCLPQVYDDALKARIEEMLSFHRQMADITDEAKRNHAQQAIQGHFRQWLQDTGKSRQLAELARMVQTGEHF